MDSQLLDYFLRAAELGSITRAAADLNLSQPALSRHIAKLEQQLAARVFIRTKGGVRLTEAGMLLADRARPLLRQFALLQEQVGERAGGQIAIGIPSSWQQVFTAHFVAALRKHDATIALRVYEGVSNALRDHMQAGLLDLAIVPFETAPTVGYRQTPLLREPLILVRSAACGLSPQSPPPIGRLDGLPMVMPARPNLLRRIVERAMNQRGLNLKIAVETDTVTLCLELARQDIGATIVPSCALPTRAAAENLSWAPMRGLQITWALCENESRSHSPVVSLATRLVLDTVKRTVTRGSWRGATTLIK
ncbi:MAG: LysR family transcriptional regulator [Pseudomonadota bacterium]|nr:LysR family transcriptional regulator [Pseudomonadota bacterium]